MYLDYIYMHIKFVGSVKNNFAQSLIHSFLFLFLLLLTYLATTARSNKMFFFRASSFLFLFDLFVWLRFYFYNHMFICTEYTNTYQTHARKQPNQSPHTISPRCMYTYKHQHFITWPYSDSGLHVAISIGKIKLCKL